jgi:hypothetical protein
MRTIFEVGVTIAFCVWVGGCASSGTVTTADGATTISANAANTAIVIGKSNKGDVVAALGKTTVINFDSGFEVWVYHVAGATPPKTGWAERIGFAAEGKGASGKTEFVVLFAPSGVVTKVRLRVAPPPGAATEK